VFAQQAKRIADTLVHNMEGNLTAGQLLRWIGTGKKTQLHANNDWPHIKLRTVKTVHVYGEHYIQIQKNHNCLRAIMHISTFGYAVSLITRQ
jgi:hypothetical protein